MNTLDHQNTHQKQSREVMEQVQAELKKLLSAVSENSAKFAAAALTIMTLSGTAQAEEMNNDKIALNSTRNPSASVPTAEKGFGQMVVLKDGRKMSFAEIAKLPQEQQDNIIGEMNDKQIEDFTNYFDTLGKVANQRKGKEKTEYEVANQEANGYAEKKEVANQELNTLDLSNLEKMQSKLSKGMKLNADDKTYLIRLKNSKRYPVSKKAEEILENPRNFA